MVQVARLADHYERRGVPDPLDSARNDVLKFKSDAPLLWRRLQDDSRLSDRQIGDRIYDILSRWVDSGVSFKNFALDELDRMG